MFWWKVRATHFCTGITRSFTHYQFLLFHINSYAVHLTNCSNWYISNLCVIQTTVHAVYHFCTIYVHYMMKISLHFKCIDNSNTACVWSWAGLNWLDYYIYMRSCCFFVSIRTWCLYHGSLVPSSGWFSIFELVWPATYICMRVEHVDPVCVLSLSISVMGYKCSHTIAPCLLRCWLHYRNNPSSQQPPKWNQGCRCVGMDLYCTHEVTVEPR